MKKFYLFLILLHLAAIAPVQAQLLQWNTFGNAGTETTEPSVFNDPNLSGVTNLTLGAGVTAAANGNRFGGNTWFDVGDTNPTTLAESVTGNDYIEFIVTPNVGFSFTPTSFVFVWDRSAASGPPNVTLRSSADGFTADLGTITSIASGTFAINTITISGLTALSTATTFRLYGYGATATGGTGGFDENVASPGVVNVQLNGTTGTASPNVLVNPGAGAYFTLKDAFDAINAGTHTGAVTVDIVGNTNEIATAVLNASGVGAASYTSVLIQPNGGLTRSVSGNLALPLIDMNGADNVTVDGLNTGGNTLTIANTNTGIVSGTSTIRFIGGATNNTITNCSLQGSATMALNTNGGIVYFATDGNTANGNDGNTISNCNIGPAGANLPTKCVYGNGSISTAAISNSGIVINNNNIFDFFISTTSVSGIHILSGNDNWTISNNRIYQTATRTFTVSAQRYAGITLNTTGSFPGAFTVTGNTIGFANAAGTGTTTINNASNEFRGIDAVRVSTTTATSIQGNIISGISQLSARGSTTFTNSSFIAIMLGTNGGSFNCGNITGNTIGSLDASSTIVITATTTASNVAPVIGIYDVSSNGNNISNNNMGSITINSGGFGTTTGFRGILLNTVTGVTATINNNTIGGTALGSITDNIIGPNGGPDYSMFGIQSTAANVSATGNIIRNITGNTSWGFGMIGIYLFGSTGVNLVSQNTVHSIINTPIITSGVILAGMEFSFPATANIVERNFIHSLYTISTNTGCTIAGIVVLNSPGTATYSNNMVSLGLKPDGSSITSSYSFYGIQDIGNNIDNFYHNSVYIGGSGVSGAFPTTTWAFYSNTTGIRNFYNNIFWNARSNAVAGGGQHVAIKVGGTTQYPAGLTSNYNVLHASGTDGVIGSFNSIFYTTLPNWRTATGQDMISIDADPKFINPAGNAATVDLHLQPATFTVCEGNGLTGLPITLDLDGQTRSSLTPVDIGADAGDFYDPLLTDLIGPEISYTPLANSSCTTPGPTLSAVITDISGVNIAAGTRPRLYYKKTTNANAYNSNTNATDGWKYVEATGAGNSPFSFIIDYSLINGGVAVGNTIQYFVTAQDLVAIPNVSINSGIYAPAFMPAGVALTATAFPVHDPVNTYTVSAPGIGANVSIGAAGTYLSLTGAGGLFDAINTAGLAANITATIIDAAVTETGAVALNQMSYGCGGPYTLTIVPAAPGTIVTGLLNNDALIKIKSSNVIIDGSSNASSSRDLSFINTSVTAPAVVLIGSTGTVPVTNTTIKNCVLINGLVTAGTALVVSDGTVLGSPGYFNNISIQNNNIQKTLTGIDAVAAAVAVNGNGLNITTNTLNAGLLNAIGNTGIKITGVDGAIISGNDIGNFESITNEVDAGIWLTTGTTNTLVEKNNIHDIQYNGIGGYGGKGIYINTGLAAANIAVQNNMIYGITGDGNDYTANGALYCPVGIYASGIGQGGINMYYNSIYLSGATLNFTADVYSIGIALDGNSAATIKNNIVKNELGLLGGIGVGAVGIAAQTSVSQFTALDYNDYFSQVTLGTNITGKIGLFNYLSLPAWQTATTMEANSLNRNPVFVSATDLHLSTANCDLDGYGTPVAGITTDIDADARDVAAPDMGADEFTATHPLVLAGVAGSAVCENKTVSPLGTTYTNNVCPIIARVLPSGGAAVSGKINVCVTLDAVQQYFNGEPYVQRHIDIEPELAPATATGTITLYFTDQEFVDYNTNNPVWPKLPTAFLGNGDPNIANLRVTQFHGTPTGGLPTTTPGNYTGTRQLINPADVDITWNGSYWSVTFDVTGFSGFYAHSTIFNVPLPITLNYLNGSKQGSKHLLNWKVTCNSTPRVTMILERSADSRNFSSIFSLTADAARCNQPFNYTDADPLKGMNYYRLKIVDADGKITYSTTIALLNAVKGFDIISIAPNPVVTDNFKLNIASAQAGKMDIAIFDMQGRLVNRQSISVIAGFNSLPVRIDNLSSGTYTIRGNMANEPFKIIRFVKQ